MFKRCVNTCSCFAVKGTCWNRLRASHDISSVLCTLYSLLPHCFIWTFFTRIALNYAQWGAARPPFEDEIFSGVFSGRSPASRTVHMGRRFRLRLLCEWGGCRCRCHSSSFSTTIFYFIGWILSSSVPGLTLGLGLAVCRSRQKRCRRWSVSPLTPRTTSLHANGTVLRLPTPTVYFHTLIVREWGGPQELKIQLYFCAAVFV